MDKTKKILKEMLTEDTGIHCMDSGGVNGRRWQRNRLRDFDNEPISQVNFSTYNSKVEISVTHNLYHWLLDRVEYNQELTKLFYSDRFRKAVGDCGETSYLQLMRDFTNWLETLKSRDGSLKYGKSTGVYKTGAPITVNSYNECDGFLDQSILFVYFENFIGGHIILQTHNGADARGGYSRPKCFSIDDFCSINYHDANIHCSKKEYHETALGIKERQENQLDLPGIYLPKIDFDHYGGSWYSDGCGSWSSSFDTDINLEKFPIKDLEDDDFWEAGKLCIKDGAGYCPTCGAKLESGF